MDLQFTAPRTLAQEAASLSSGTLATLTGYRDYALLDEIHAAFVAYCQAHPQYATWARAWDAWQHSLDTRTVTRKPVQQTMQFGFTLEG
jgi:lysozyme family protein